MKLHFENIVYFVAVVEEGSFSSAARKLGKSQSTVSTAVQNLESDLGFNLFNRNFSRVQLTEKGKRLYHLSLPVVSKYRDLLITAKQMNSSEQIVYRVGIDPLIYNNRIKNALLGFSEAFPKVDLVVVTKPSFVLGNYINERKIDLAIGNPYYKTGNNFNIEELFNVNFWWFSHKDLNTNLNKSSIRVLLMDGCEELLSLSNIESYNLWQIDDLLTILELCKAKKGIALLPEFLALEDNKNNTLKVVNDHPDFFGKHIVASLFGPNNSDFELFNKWIREEIKTNKNEKTSFLTNLIT